MQDLLEVTGLILRSEPHGEYDRRVVILTAERGKISCFAKGARKPGNRFLSSTNPLNFGTFMLYEGRSAYSMNEASITNFFEELRNDYSAACYGMYFLELADYYTLENNDERQMLGLLYQSLRAIQKGTIELKLIKCVMELKALMYNGEYPGVPPKSDGTAYDESTLYTIKYIESSPLNRLYTFAVSEKVLNELVSICDVLQKRFMDRPLKSLEILNDL